MDFWNYANRILALNDCDFSEKPKADTNQMSKLTVIAGRMEKKQ